MEKDNNKCNLSTCRYNHNGICQNEEKREECVEVSEAVLCLKDEESDNTSLAICETNPKCKNVDKCSFAIEVTTFANLEKGELIYICGREPCEYATKK